jgi:ribosome biogenesis GTPase
MWDEEEYFTRKELKGERKQLQQKDRSKYKKTDQKKQVLSEALQEGCEEGRVLSIISKNINVQSSNGTMYLCSLKGILKKEKAQDKNLVIVGDLVLFEPLDQREGVIHSVCPRKSILSRQDNLHRIKRHLIAANVDQVFIIQSCVMPAIKPPIIDRYLIAAEKGCITPVLVFNKIDLITKGSEEEELLETCSRMYTKLGISVLLVSAETKEGMDTLKEKMKDSTSVFSGQSGTGKTSLINAVSGLKLVTADIVFSTNKGAHTTSTARLLELPFGGYCVDTPGIRSFGVWDLEPDDLKHYFSEFFQESSHCTFHDCSHLHEPGCQIQKMVEEKGISPLRYDSYVNLYESLKKIHKPR